MPTLAAGLPPRMSRHGTQATAAGMRSVLPVVCGFPAAPPSWPLPICRPHRTLVCLNLLVPSPSSRPVQDNLPSVCACSARQLLARLCDADSFGQDTDSLSQADSGSSPDPALLGLVRFTPLEFAFRASDLLRDPDLVRASRSVAACGRRAAPPLCLPATAVCTPLPGRFQEPGAGQRSERAASLRPCPASPALDTAADNGPLRRAQRLDRIQDQRGRQPAVWQEARVRMQPAGLGRSQRLRRGQRGAWIQQGVEIIRRRIAAPGGGGHAMAVESRRGAEISRGGRCREAMQAVPRRRMACMVELGRRLPATPGELRGMVPAFGIPPGRGLREFGLVQRACHSQASVRMIARRYFAPCDARHGPSWPARAAPADARVGTGK